MSTTLPISDHALAAARAVMADIDHTTDPVATARLLPPAVYTSTDFWEFEKEAIFHREWLCIGHVNEVPEPGDQLPLTILDEPIVMLRDLSGHVRVMSAVCQHRGQPLFGGLAGEGRSAAAPCLSGRVMKCPYHNWAFDLDGRLAAAPSMTETVPVKRLRETIRLPQIRHEIFHGLVFINFDDNAAPLAPSVARMDEELSTFGLEELVPMPASVFEDQKWNWKIHHDNALEPYHTSYVHRGVHEAAPAKNARFYDFERGDGQVMHPTYLLDENAGLASTDGRRTTSIIPGLTDEQRKRVMFASIPPMLFSILQPTFVQLAMIHPNGPGSMDLRRVNLYPKSAVEEPGFHEAYEKFLDRKSLAIHQDAVTTAALQQGLRSRYAPRGPLSWMESNIPQLNAWLVERYQKALDTL
ncbi:MULTISPECIES: aromatic ring-hydroxylating dioxygenase subunit alpha [unclassified Streptomyces]|uniref:aromatic ring-hydroxylating oxygenase subunit alpha n=1 Tax=unclassified Streptomyces TaxID=2593676 RepID=UPI00081E53EA|nr:MULTISPECIES: aromatic ring-hydroxylating dioxygenase subunit alpha [unclassified Streptomyces]MYZ36568.1 Rieske 2Fe-2S domain-containing protein [Streptomyces sp. SID4917]SCF84577.1 Phenylpropionate dioxygenase, large terminal subunit [Streptomyces sp. MnatMP-M17]